jgi:hypothetical protein
MTTEVQRPIAPDALVLCPHQGMHVPIGSVARGVSVERCSVPGKACPHLADCFLLKLRELVNCDPACWTVVALLKQPLSKCQTCPSQEACECDRLPLNRYAATA